MIRIFKDEIEIDVVKDTLTINRDNKFLDNDFKIQANSFPFMIIENEKTHRVLGSKQTTSSVRNTFHKVSVLTPEGTFEGELQILAYLKNFRKCNLRFYSPIYNLRDKKITEFLPDRISTVQGSIQPLYDYEENRTTVIEPMFMNTWETYGPSILPLGFPNTLFNLPSYLYPNKFGDLTEDDDWFAFNGTINGVFFDNGQKYMYSNSYMVNNGVQFNNQTINAPQVYLLAPLKLAVESVGYKVTGSFYNSEFIKRILFYSDKNNLTEVQLSDLIMSIPYLPGGWKPLALIYTYKQILFQLPVGRKYRIEMQLKNISSVPVFGLVTAEGINGNFQTQIFENPPENELQTYTAEFVTPATGTAVSNVAITFIRQTLLNVEIFEFNYIRIYEVADKKGYLSHPIINLQRFVPDWTFIDYINELKKLFNLKITPNDHNKTISFDFFNEKFVTSTGVKIDSLQIEEYETHEFDSLLLKYDNEEDTNVLVTKTNVLVGKNKVLEHSKEVLSKFKFMPVTSNGLILTKEIEDKGGVGLVIYNHLNATTSAPTQSYQGFSLTLENIYNKNYKLSFKNYLHSGVFTTNGYLSNKQIKDIAAEDFVIIDNKRYYVNTMSYKETPNGLYETKLELLLMIY